MSFPSVCTPCGKFLPSGHWLGTSYSIRPHQPPLCPPCRKTGRTVRCNGNPHSIWRLVASCAYSIRGPLCYDKQEAPPRRISCNGRTISGSPSPRLCRLQDCRRNRMDSLTNRCRQRRDRWQFGRLFACSCFILSRCRLFSKKWSSSYHR